MHKPDFIEGSPRILISGGGTGGHIFPALAIAEEVKRRYPNAAIHFVGAQGRMEMEKVPQHGYTITGLPIAGFNRASLLKNLSLPGKVLGSLRQVSQLLNRFQPEAVVGVGGYASGPTAFLAGIRGIPVLLQEQNGYPGVTNKILARFARKICVAYPNMEKYFPKDKIVFTGNPVRKFSDLGRIPREEAASYFGLNGREKILLVLGGSLGARTINESILGGLDKLMQAGTQVLWQTGRTYFEQMDRAVKGRYGSRIKVLPFIDNMEYAYSIANAVVSRAGAISLSELAVVGRPSILVPSPNVAEDHQTKNALAMVNKEAALLISDAVAATALIPSCLQLMQDEALCLKLENNILAFARPDATRDIVDELLGLIKA